MRSTLDFPPTLVSTIEGAQDTVGLIGVILFILAILAILIVAFRNRWFVYPASRLGVLIFLALLISGIAKENLYRREYIVDGFGMVITEFLGTALFGPVVFGLFLYFLIGLMYGVLRSTRPDLIPGMADAPRLGISRTTWLRSAVVGLAGGGIVAAGAILPEWGIMVMSGANNYLNFNAIPVLSIFSQIGSLFEKTVFATGFLLSAMAGIVILERYLKFGKLVWPVAVLVGAAVLSGSFLTQFDLKNLMNLAAIVGVCLVLWVSFRFGFLAGAFTWISSSFIEDAVYLFHLDLSLYKGIGIFWLLLWLVLLIITFTNLLKTNLSQANS